MLKKFQDGALDSVIDEMVDVVANSKDEIFEISEEARKEHSSLLKEIAITKERVLEYINTGNKLENEVRDSRKKLADVSKNFDRYSEKQIREVYDSTHLLQTRLIMLRQEERTLRDKRDTLERRLVSLMQTIDRAEDIASKISVVLNYLSDDFKKVNVIIEEARERQAFGLQIIEAQEEERKRISREIHDGPAQMLANILLRSELVERAYKKGDADRALKEMKDVRKMVRTSLYEVRRIIYDLRPMALDDLGLIPTLKKYADTISDYNEAKIVFTMIGEEKRLDSKYEVALFRLVQESLQNAVKHAEAKTIQIKMEITDKNITLLIKDDGKGFDTDGKKKNNSFGLIGMRERVEMLDGKLEIKSTIGKGTTVLIQVPIVI